VEKLGFDFVGEFLLRKTVSTDNTDDTECQQESG